MFMKIGPDANELSNAIKFTREGRVKLTVISFAEDESQSSVKVSVEDSGVGISQENISKLFRDYTHIDFNGREAMNPTGVGLGLNIAYNLAKLLSPKDHSGINVVSVPNKGSVFSFV